MRATAAETYAHDFTRVAEFRWTLVLGLEAIGLLSGLCGGASWSCGIGGPIGLVSRGPWFRIVSVFRGGDCDSVGMDGTFEGDR